MERYGHICPQEQGKIIKIAGIGGSDYYNPSVYSDSGETTLAFRKEKRNSDWHFPGQYKPSIAFARQDDNGQWHQLAKPAPYNMLEDPAFFVMEEGAQRKVVMSGVRVRMETADLYIPNTEYYIGGSLEALARRPFATVIGMKDVRLAQLPDGRILICRRPRGGRYGNGRITLHILDSLGTLEQLHELELPILAVLNSHYAHDWVGTNNVYIKIDHAGEAWVCLLGHIGLADHDQNKHYAAVTYKISLKRLLAQGTTNILPSVIATRACFEDGPKKTDQLEDVVFPGSLESLGGERYRLWAGLSDARIGTIIVDDPFGLRG